MDDYEMARLALDAVETAARIARREQRRRQRQQRQVALAKDPAAPSESAYGATPPQRQPAFDMPTNPDGEIPDEFLPRM